MHQETERWHMPASYGDMTERFDLWETFGVRATVRPFRICDPETGRTVSLSISPYYSVLTIDSRSYYFVRETGEYDGWSDDAS